MNNINRKTISLCPICAKEIPATIFYKDDVVWMYKTCCGKEWTAPVEVSVPFYEVCKKLSPPPIFSPVIFDPLFIDVTSRCNILCPHCFKEINNESKDPSIQEIINSIKDINSPKIGLFGGEPTVREDLPEIIRRITATGKIAEIVTNGIKLSNKQYLIGLINNGLEHISISLHHKNYNGEAIYKKKKDGINNIREIIKEQGNNKPTLNLMFTLNSLDELSEVFDDIYKNRDIVKHYRVRTPSMGGYLGNTPKNFKNIFLSELMSAISNEAQKRNAKIDFMGGDDNIYHLNIYFDGIAIRVIHPPGIYDVDINELQMPPYRLSEDGRILNAVHSWMIKDIQKANKIQKQGISEYQPD